MFTHCVIRDRATQDALKANGFSKAEYGQSPHNYGLAADVVHSVRAWELTDKEWSVLGVIGKEAARKLGVKIEWGGDWSFYDPAHWQLADWRHHTIGKAPL